MHDFTQLRKQTLFPEGPDMATQSRGHATQGSETTNLNMSSG
jgi:hypothetical protein